MVSSRVKVSGMSAPDFAMMFFAPRLDQIARECTGGWWFPGTPVEQYANNLWPCLRLKPAVTLRPRGWTKHRGRQTDETFRWTAGRNHGRRADGCGVRATGGGADRAGDAGPGQAVRSVRQ